MHGPDALDWAKAASGQFCVLLDGPASLRPAHVIKQATVRVLDLHPQTLNSTYGTDSTKDSGGETLNSNFVHQFWKEALDRVHCFRLFFAPIAGCDQKASPDEPVSLAIAAPVSLFSIHFPDSASGLDSTKELNHLTPASCSVSKWRR
jgi:hypothetical protein